MAKCEDYRVDKSSLQPGDHISVDRKPIGFRLYSHHGIYTGDHPNEVIHFSGKTKWDSKVRECTLEEFLNGGQVELVKYHVPRCERSAKKAGSCHTSRCRGADRVIKTANRLLKDPASWDEYSLLLNNCEHFAYFCKTKKIMSAQAYRYTLREGTEASVQLGSYVDDNVTPIYTNPKPVPDIEPCHDNDSDPYPDSDMDEAGANDTDGSDNMY